MLHPMVVLRWCAACAAGMVVLLLGLSLGMGVNVALFERVADPAGQVHALLQQAVGLRWLMLPAPHLGWRVLKFTMVFVQLPMGVMALVWQGMPWGDALLWWRLVNVLGGFAALAVMLPWPPAGGSDARA